MPGRAFDCDYPSFDPHNRDYTINEENDAGQLMFSNLWQEYLELRSHAEKMRRYCRERSVMEYLADGQK